MKKSLLHKSVVKSNENGLLLNIENKKKSLIKIDNRGGQTVKRNGSKYGVQRSITKTLIKS